MQSRRQRKIARVIRDSVSYTIHNRLSDPRISGLVSVTEVQVSPDAKQATVFLSIFGVDEPARDLTFSAIEHAAGPIQASLGSDMPGRVCPHLQFEQDAKMKKTLETLTLIEQARQDFEDKDPEAEDDDSETDRGATEAQ